MKRSRLLTTRRKPFEVANNVRRTSKYRGQSGQQPPTLIHVKPIPWHNVKAKKALSPMLGACAKGNFAIKASKIVAMADAIAVAVNTPALSMPVVLRIIGFTANI